MLRDLIIEEYVLEPLSGGLKANGRIQDLKMAAKRYSHKGVDGTVDPSRDGLTLIFCHSLSARMFHPSLFARKLLIKEHLTKIRNSGSRHWGAYFLAGAEAPTVDRAI